MTDYAAFFEKVAQAFERPEGDGLGLADLAKRIDPKTVQTPALDLIDAATEELLATPNGRLQIACSPQEGKTQRVGITLPVALLRARPDTRIVVASYGHTLARRNSAAIRDAIISNPGLGLRISKDTAAKDEWRIEGHQGGVYAAGVGTALTGRACDFMIIDDPHANMRDAESPTMQENAWSWWLSTAATRLAPGAQVLLIATRWAEGDLPGRMQAAEDGHLWRVVNIPAQADHRPEKGEVDVLGREPGEYMISARGRTPAEWEAIKIRSGSRVWAAMYMGRPAPQEGGLLKRHWWRRYGWPMWLEYDNGTRWIPGNDAEVVMSVDCAFKDLDTSDYFVAQVWMRRGAEVFLLDQVRGRFSFPETLQAIRGLSAKWPQATSKFVEDRANGPAVIQALARTVPGLIPVQPEGSKAARAAAVSPYVEAGNVWIPEPEIAPWVDDFVEECAAFGGGSKNDDQVDAFSQALNRLLLSPWIDLGVIEPEDFDDDHRIRISRY